MAGIILIAIILCINMLHTTGCPVRCKCQNKEVNCKNVEMKTFPNLIDIPDTARKLNLYNTSLSNLSVTWNQNEEIQSITHVNLEVNSLLYIPENSALSYFPRVTEVLLGNNYIESINNNSFTELKFLEHLYLENNNLKIFAKGIFTGLSNLHRLSLSNNKIEDMHGSFGGLEKLNKLLLQNNEIEQIRDKEFYGLENLSELALGGNNLETIRRGVFHGLKNLDKLSLSQNKISYIDRGCFTHISKLSRLYLNSNKIPSIEKVHWPQLLVCLDLHKNEIKHISEDGFLGLSKLQVLDVSYNKLISVKMNWFYSLESLRQLYLHNNSIKVFEPDDFSWPTKLEEIWLQNNAILQLPPLTKLVVEGKMRTTVLLQGNRIICECRRKEHLKNLTKLLLQNLRFCCYTDITCNKAEGTWKRQETNFTLAPWPVTLHTWVITELLSQIKNEHFMLTYATSPVCEKPSCKVSGNSSNSMIYFEVSGHPKPGVEFAVETLDVQSISISEMNVQVQYICSAENMLGKGKDDLVINENVKCKGTVVPRLQLRQLSKAGFRLRATTNFTCIPLNNQKSPIKRYNMTVIIPLIICGILSLVSIFFIGFLVLLENNYCIRY